MAKTEQKMIEQLSELTFGIEIETTSISRRNAALAIVAVTGGTVEAKSAYSGSFWAVMPDGRKWAAVTDGSIGYDNAEVVSPVLRYSDIPMMQEVVRSLKRNGARVDSRCGIHVHVGTQTLNGKALVRLASYWNRQEVILQRMFNANPARYADSGWAAPLTPEFVASLENGTIRPDAVRSRYKALNLQNCITRNGNAAAATVEFRAFDATLHAGKIRAWVQFCLAMVNKAKRGKWSQKSQNARRTFDPSTAKYDARTINLRLNLSGDEFATCRLHLTRHLTGTSSTAGTNGRRDRRAHQARQAAQNAAQVAPVANVVNL